MVLSRRRSIAFDNFPVRGEPVELGFGRLKKKDAEGPAWMQGKLFVACLIERLIALGDHFPLPSVRSTEKQATWRRCRWHETAFVHWLMSAAVNPRLSLFDNLERWVEMLIFCGNRYEKNVITNRMSLGEGGLVSTYWAIPGGVGFDNDVVFPFPGTSCGETANTTCNATGQYAVLYLIDGSAML